MPDPHDPRLAGGDHRNEHRDPARARPQALELLEQQKREIATAMEAVRRTSTEIQSLFDRLPDLVVIHRRGVILWTNRAAVTTAAKAHLFGPT